MTMQHQKIDRLRDLLDTHDREKVSFVILQGLDELPSYTQRVLAESGDVAYVFLGPKDKIQGVVTQQPDGSLTASVTVTLQEAP